MQIKGQSQVEDKLINRRQLMVDNNISCRRISKEKTITDFIISNNFVRGLLVNSISDLKKHEAFKQKSPRMMVSNTLINSFPKFKRKFMRS